MANRYSNKNHKDQGFGRFSLYQNGEWLETFHTEAERDAERVNRQEFDAIWLKYHGRLGS